QYQEDDLGVTDAPLEGVELSPLQLELRLLNQTLCLTEPLSDRATRVVELSVRAHGPARFGAEPRQRRKAAQHVRKPLLPPVARRRGGRTGRRDCPRTRGRRTAAPPSRARRRARSLPGPPPCRTPWGGPRRPGPPP